MTLAKNKRGKKTKDHIDQSEWLHGHVAQYAISVQSDPQSPTPTSSLNNSMPQSAPENKTGAFNQMDHDKISILRP